MYPFLQNNNFLTSYYVKLQCLKLLHLHYYNHAFYSRVTIPTGTLHVTTLLESNVLKIIILIYIVSMEKISPHNWKRVQEFC